MKSKSRKEFLQEIAVSRQVLTPTAQLQMGANHSQGGSRRHVRRAEKTAQSAAIHSNPKEIVDPNVPVIADPNQVRGVDLPPPRHPSRRSKVVSADSQITGALSDVFQTYTLDKKELGHGHFGTVRTATHRETGKKFAIKTIPKAKVGRFDTLRREIDILKTVDHPNIIKLFEVYEDARNLHLVTELCTGGELFDRIIARGHYTEADAAVLIRKLLTAIVHCHSLGICHRDLKPENFLFETPADDAEIKVIDFGLSRVGLDQTAGAFMTTRVGTPYYIAPEVLGRHYDLSCDMWSLGVITFILLSGYPPFYGDSDPEIFAAVRSGKYTFDTPEWKDISSEAKDFISNLLQLQPARRMTAENALKHVWVSGSMPLETTSLVTGQLITSLKRFSGNNKLKKAALKVIANELTETEIIELKTAFTEIDADGNGFITISELHEAMISLGHGILEDEVRELLKGVDVDSDGKIDYNVFLAATMERNLFIKEQHLQNAFNYFDTKKQGSITKEDLVQFMGSEEHAQELMDEIDENCDGLISFEEFVSMMKHRGLNENESKPSKPSPDTIFTGFIPQETTL